LTVYVIGKISCQQQAIGKVFEESKIACDFSSVGDEIGDPITILFKDQLYRNVIV
jgi:hypothetical protein